MRETEGRTLYLLDRLGRTKSVGSFLNRVVYPGYVARNFRNPKSMKKVDREQSRKTPR